MTSRPHRLHSGSSLNDFDDVAREHLDGMLATYGFLLEMSKVETGFAMRRYRNGHRYITVEVVTQKGNPPIGRAKVGTGKAEWPDADWNNIPLWHLVKERHPEHESTDYLLDNLTIESFVQSVSKDLQDFAMDFMAGELFAFKRLRAEISRQKAPYELYGSGPYTESTLKFMRISKLLKEKYSDEAAA